MKVKKGSNYPESYFTAEEPKPLKNNSELLHAAHCFILYTGGKILCRLRNC